LFKKDVNTWEKIEAKTLELNDIARVQIDMSEKIAFDLYEDNIGTGAFILIDKIKVYPSLKTSTIKEIVPPINPAIEEINE